VSVYIHRAVAEYGDRHTEISLLLRYVPLAKSANLAFTFSRAYVDLVDQNRFLLCKRSYEVFYVHRRSLIFDSFRVKQNSLFFMFATYALA
jgi:hypothetical protein